MKEMGAQVDYIYDKPNEGFIAKTLGRLGFRFYQNILNKYYAKSLEVLKEKEYDFILVIRGEYTPKETLELLKEKYSSAKLILYMWDGLHKQNTRGIEKNGVYMIKCIHLIELIMKLIRKVFLSFHCIITINIYRRI